MSAVLETYKLTKHFGRIKAVQELDLSVQEGQVYGILGPNGSGKTTTLGMILGVTSITGGKFSWFGAGDHYSMRKKIGAILEHPVFYPYMNGLQNLAVSAKIKEVKNPPYDDVLKMVGLYDRRKDAFKTYSLGMKQRLAIASSLLADPVALIFDEPTNGLDPQGIAEIRHTIIRIAEMGKTIVLASHLLDEVQKVCTHFAVLRRGSKLFDGSVKDVLNRKGGIELMAKDSDRLKQVLGEFKAIKSMTTENGVILADVDENLNPSDLNRYLLEKGIALEHLMQRRSNLEEQFLEILKEDDDQVTSS